MPVAERFVQLVLVGSDLLPKHLSERELQVADPKHHLEQEVGPMHRSPASMPVVVPVAVPLQVDHPKHRFALKLVPILRCSVVAQMVLGLLAIEEVALLVVADPRRLAPEVDPKHLVSELVPVAEVLVVVLVVVLVEPVRVLVHLRVVDPMHFGRHQADPRHLSVELGPNRPLAGRLQRLPIRRRIVRANPRRLVWVQQELEPAVLVVQRAAHQVVHPMHLVSFAVHPRSHQVFRRVDFRRMQVRCPRHHFVLARHPRHLVGLSRRPKNRAFHLPVVSPTPAGLLPALSVVLVAFEEEIDSVEETEQASACPKSLVLALHL